MPNRKKGIGKADPGQTSLLELLRRAAELEETGGSEGSAVVQPRLSQAMAEAIRRSGLSRWEAAGRMSHLLGREITKYMLDGWTAESKEGHRFPAEFLPAFCLAVGSRAVVRILADAAGLFVLPGPDALRAEVQKLREEELRLSRERKKREAFLREMEG